MQYRFIIASFISHYCKGSSNYISVTNPSNTPLLWDLVEKEGGVGLRFICHWEFDGMLEQKSFSTFSPGKLQYIQECELLMLSEYTMISLLQK